MAAFGSGRTTMDTTLDITEMMEFDKSDGPSGQCEGKRLYRHWIFKSLFIACWSRFRESMETADWSKKQTAQSLFDHPNWRNMKFGTRIAVGRVLRFFVKNEWLPLVVTNPKSTGTKYYELATPVQTSADQDVNPTFVTNTNQGQNPL